MALAKQVLVLTSRLGPRQCAYLSTVPSSKKVTKYQKVPLVMKAWNLYSYKGPSGLTLNTDCEVPTLTRSNELLVQVKAASINPLDLMMSSGYGFSALELMQSSTKCTLPNAHDPFPLRVGRDFSGVVVDKGMEANSFQVGDEVWGTIWPSCQGSFGEYIAVPMDYVSRKPNSLGHTEAASIPYAGLTCWSSVVTTGNLDSKTSPKKILIVGASGGVGTIAVQLLKAWAHEVVAVAPQSAAPILLDLGADLVLDYSQTDYQQLLKKAGQFDLILDYSGQRKEADYIRHLRPGLSSKVVSTSSPLLMEMDKKGVLFGTLASLCQLGNLNLESMRDKGATVRWAFYSPSKEGLDTLHDLVNQGKLRPVVNKVYKMDEILDAFEEVQKGSVIGKLVIEM